jgi:hypothetical protein
MKKKHRTPKSVRYGLGEKEWRRFQDEFQEQSDRDCLLDHPVNINQTPPGEEESSQSRINASFQQADAAAKRRHLASSENSQVAVGHHVNQNDARRQKASEWGAVMSPIGDISAAAADQAKRRQVATSENTQVTAARKLRCINRRRQMASTAAADADGGGDRKFTPAGEAQEAQSWAGDASECRHLATSEDTQVQEEQEVSKTRARR